MLHVTLANLRAHKRRLLATFAAVLLGVAFLAGVLVQTATLQTGFDELFDTQSASVDAVVRSSRSIADEQDDTIRPRIDATLVDRVRATPGVRAVAGDVRGRAIILGEDGDKIGGFGPPQLGMTWIDDPALTPYRLADGRAPRAADEVVIDLESAKAGDLQVGDATTILTPQPTRVRVVGTARFGTADGQGGATAALFSPAGARAHLAGGADGVDRILVDAEPGTRQAALVRSVGAATASGSTETISGEAYRLENRAQVDDVMGFLRPVLVSFALIALLVAAFSIYNTFAIIVAQRTREAAMLRAIGASRGQTLRAVLVEALLVGLVASTAGVGAGIGIAALLGRVLGSAGLDLGHALVLAPATLFSCVVVGTVLTTLCALGPAVRASRVTPIAALRESSVDQTGATFKRLALGGVLAAGGIGLVATGMSGDGSMGTSALGVAIAIVALAVLGPAVAGPVGRTLGWPLRLRGVTGDLARQNAVRNPRRTSSSSTALMIGVAVVALFTVMGASLRASLDQMVNEGFGGDLVATGDLGGVGFDPAVGRHIAAVPQVRASAALGNAPMTVDGEDTIIGTTDLTTLGQLMDLDVQQGSLADVTGPSLAISTVQAEKEGWTIGSKVPYEFLDGTSGTMAVRAIFGDTQLAGDLLAPSSFAQGHGSPASDVVVLVDLKPGVSLAEGRRAVEAATSGDPAVTIQDKQEFTDAVGGQINQLLVLVYGMLALSIVIALIGIANTLSLSTFERTRELGLLRAVGQARSQTRAMVRWESVIIAVFGTVLGLVVGVLGAWALISSTGESSELSVLAFPGGQLGLVLGLGALAGVLAALRPAARAAKLDPLTAIASS